MGEGGLFVEENQNHSIYNIPCQSRRIRNCHNKNHSVSQNRLVTKSNKTPISVKKSKYIQNNRISFQFNNSNIKFESKKKKGKKQCSYYHTVSCQIKKNHCIY